ncbi:hypothetical protein VTH06DRAFT_5003 [Thermothelomyces fergusii]
MVSRFATDPSGTRTDLLLGKEIRARPRTSENIPRSQNYPKVAPRSFSKPFGFELPGTGSGIQRKNSASAAFTSPDLPPEPLSARGDVPGGYFPLHEDPESRIRIPHPFHFDAEMARKSSQKRAAESSRSGMEPRALPITHAPQPEQEFPDSLTSPANFISSYVPSGHDDVVLPMGKYYPSNWEKRHGKAPQTNRPPATTQPAAPVIRSEPQVPKDRHGDQAHHHGLGSDVKRRLQQYQRDMVAQAAMAASALLASSGSAGSSGALSKSGLPPSVPRGQFAAAFLRTHGPLSPTLKPVGSPGPVTPMSLETDCYLGLGSSAGAAAMDASEFSCKGKQYEGDSVSSPAVELSVASI